MKWSYGVTTVPSRIDTLLPRTLASLKLAGFTDPRIFIDGADFVPQSLCNYECTCRYPNIRTHGNWFLSAHELYIREPQADRYAIFQDDFVTYRNLRSYLDVAKYPEKAYLNLYTFPENTRNGVFGWYPSNQRGKGAVALVFSKEAFQLILSSRHMIDRVTDIKRGHRAIDGGVVTAFKKQGWREFVHMPSLVQHTGLESSMGNSKHPLAPSFRGENFDAGEWTR